MYKGELSIKKWAEEDRPREKLMLKGKAVLSDAELLGIILGSGTRSLSAVDLSKYILSQVGNNLNELAKYSVSDLTKFKGIGPAKAISIVSALELGRRRKASEVLEKPKITCSADAYEVIKPYLMDLHHEEFWLLLLNRSNLVMATHKVSSGGISGTVADPKLIFKKALEVSCSAVILVHNHPSGNLNPSSADIKLTKKLVEAGKLLDLPILDHLIFTDQAHFSFADEGMI